MSRIMCRLLGIRDRKRFGVFRVDGDEQERRLEEHERLLDIIAQAQCQTSNEKGDWHTKAH